jgi:hypothetical protein
VLPSQCSTVLREISFRRDHTVLQTWPRKMARALNFHPPSLPPTPSSAFPFPPSRHLAFSRAHFYHAISNSIPSLPGYSCISTPPPLPRPPPGPVIHLHCRNRRHTACGRAGNTRLSCAPHAPHRTRRRCSVCVSKNVGPLCLSCAGLVMSTAGGGALLLFTLFFFIVRAIGSIPQQPRDSRHLRRRQVRFGI